MSNIEQKTEKSTGPTVCELVEREIESVIYMVADKRSIPALISLLDDPDFDVNWIAAESLIRIGRKSIVPLLISIRDRKNFSCPSAYHILQSLLTGSEKEALQPLLSTLAGMSEETAEAGIEASIALKNVFRYMN